MRLNVEINRRNSSRIVEVVLGIAAFLVGIARMANFPSGQGHILYGSGPTFSTNVLTLMQAGGFASYSVIGMCLLLLVIAAASIFHVISHSSIIRMVLLAAVVGLAALVVLTFATIGMLLILSLVLGLGATVLSFAWR